ncbi:hypothetical protein BS47DRAFT_1364897 [Hydnum rufescens UP504]|uniref:Uncharacterized protein n=1 Tax=Hydnum rufescens UP504 TaxID=1448309 RepID=A0A9P6DSZ7_9AGAM|nr:hypothetical protein BS47DRAFT_1364897 [Hydnum rufescens UP504]
MSTTDDWSASLQNNFGLRAGLLAQWYSLRSPSQVSLSKQGGGVADSTKQYTSHGGNPRCTHVPRQAQSVQGTSACGGYDCPDFPLYLLIITIPATTIPHYYGNSGTWCWTANRSVESSRLKIGSEYAYFWLAAIVTFVLYGIIAVNWLRGASAKRVRRLGMIVPVSLVRFLEWRPKSPGPRHGFIIAADLLRPIRFLASPEDEDEEDHERESSMGALPPVSQGIQSPAAAGPGGESHFSQPNFPDEVLISRAAHVSGLYVRSSMRLGLELQEGLAMLRFSMMEDRRVRGLGRGSTPPSSRQKAIYGPLHPTQRECHVKLNETPTRTTIKWLEPERKSRLPHLYRGELVEHRAKCGLLDEPIKAGRKEVSELPFRSAITGREVQMNTQLLGEDEAHQQYQWCFGASEAQWILLMLQLLPLLALHRLVLRAKLI